MNLLLDTHAFIWWAPEPDKLSERVLNLLKNRENQLILSVASAWEMQIKMQLGKLKLETALQDLIKSQQITNELKILVVNLKHVLELDKLPYHHKDPLDRILIAQANIEDFTIASKDDIFSKYPVKVIW